jgi:hypothetical protein
VGVRVGREREPPGARSTYSGKHRHCMPLPSGVGAGMAWWRSRRRAARRRSGTSLRDGGDGDARDAGDLLAPGSWGPGTPRRADEAAQPGDGRPPQAADAQVRACGAAVVGEDVRLSSSLGAAGWCLPRRGPTRLAVGMEELVGLVRRAIGRASDGRRQAQESRQSAAAKGRASGGSSSAGLEVASLGGRPLAVKSPVRALKAARRILIDREPVALGASARESSRSPSACQQARPVLTPAGFWRAVDAGSTEIGK